MFEYAEPKRTQNSKSMVQKKKRAAVSKAAGPSFQDIEVQYGQNIVQRHKDAEREDIAAINYSIAAQEFEEQLGKYLSTYGPAVSEIKELLRKIVEVGVTEKPGVSGTPAIPINETTRTWYGTNNTSVAGMVGTEIRTLREVVQEGNLREQLTMLFNLVLMCKDPEKPGNMSMNSSRLPEHLSMRDDRFSRAEQDKVRNPGLWETRTRERAYYTWINKGRPEQSKEEQDEDYRKAVEKYKYTHIKDAEPIISPDLSEREIAAGNSVDNLKWKPGAHTWDYEMSTPLQIEANNLRVPIVAGISGTSYAILNVAARYGADLEKVRLALLGYLLPGRNHSFHEVMVACEAFDSKLKYDNTEKRYRLLAPLTEPELRACGNKGEFPDEIAKKNWLTDKSAAGFVSNHKFSGAFYVNVYYSQN